MPWISKEIIESFIRRQNDLERRVKRLELMSLKDAENKIASLRGEEAGKVHKDGFLTIEKIVKNRESVV